ncbi:MAG TPA: YheC/YheD family protein [Bacillota bacterium]|nr:YheC/YheD family protein [Bacillota bacterium]
MESKRVQIQLLQSQQYNGIIISTDLCKELGIDSQKNIYVQLGERKVWTRILKTKRTDLSIIIPTSLRTELNIPFGGKLHVIVENDTLRIGPVVGILTTGIQVKDHQLISQRASFFKHLLSAQKEESLFYFLFTPADVNWSNKIVSGLFLSQNNGVAVWRRGSIPFPDVVYNRIPDRGSERTASVQDFKTKLANLTQAQMFNPTFFNKWAIHQQLVNHPTVGQYIPETFHSPNLNTIQMMLKKYRLVYLKPVGGSLGLGILRITFKPGEGYFCRYNNGSNNILRRYRNLSSLIATHLPRQRMNNYLVQQGISLIKYEDRPLDFRVHVHKNRENQWVVAAIAAKIAGEGSVTTHVRTGGTVLSGQELLKEVYYSQGEYFAEQVRECTIQLAEVIETKLKQNIGELGFDIGIDTKGRIWMFEANSRPGRSIFKYDSFKEADQRSIHLIVDYSRYLSKFN